MTPLDIQRALRARGFDLGRSGPTRDGVDGIIGDRTRAAIRAFQRAKGLKVTGVVDYLTGVTLAAPVGPEVAVAPPPSFDTEDILPALWMPPARMRGIVVHWTAGAWKASAHDRSCYHFLVEDDAEVVLGVPVPRNDLSGLAKGYAAHTRNCNTGWIGVSLCCMGEKNKGEVRESPFNPGPWPMTRAQWDRLPQVLAILCRRYAIAVTPQTVLSHAEVQSTLGIAQAGKWDISRLAFDLSVVGARACGDIFRRRTAALV